MTAVTRPIAKEGTCPRPHRHNADSPSRFRAAPLAVPSPKEMCPSLGRSSQMLGAVTEKHHEVRATAMASQSRGLKAAATLRFLTWKINKYKVLCKQ